jgi:restriction endonuclease S subunit
MKVKIKEIATVRSGVYTKEQSEGEVYYLQVNSFEREVEGINLSTPKVAMSDKIDSHLLEEGDIIMTAKGTSNFSVVFKGEVGKAVASSSFLVLRIKDKAVLNPDYLCWILNREDSLCFFRTNARGTSMPSISKSIVENFEIEIPAMQIQKKIVSIAKLRKQEQQIAKELFLLRSKLIEKQLTEITKKIILYGE